MINCKDIQYFDMAAYSGYYFSGLPISLFLHQQHQFFTSLMKTYFIKDLLESIDDVFAFLGQYVAFRVFFLSLHHNVRRR